MDRNWIGLAFTIGLALTPALATADDRGEEAMKIARKVTAEGAKIFDSLDAPAMAATYAEEAALVVLAKDSEGRVEAQRHEGRAKVQAFYAKLFEKPQTIKSRNTVEHAKLLAPDVLTIDGVFEPDTLKSDSMKIPFHQVRVKKDDAWKIVQMEIAIVPNE